MTILKNKYFVGQEVYSAIDKEIVVIKSISSSAFDHHESCIYSIRFHFPDSRREERQEHHLYDSKEAYEAEKNQIRVGDEFYFISMRNGRVFIKKEKANVIDGEYIYNPHGVTFNKAFCFKTKDLLLEVVKKAVEECE